MVLLMRELRLPADMGSFPGLSVFIHLRFRHSSSSLFDNSVTIWYYPSYASHYFFCPLRSCSAGTSLDLDYVFIFLLSSRQQTTAVTVVLAVLRTVLEYTAAEKVI